MYDPSIAEQLRRLGHDAVAAGGRVEIMDLPDSELFAFAQVQQRALATNNVGDFLILDQRYRQLRRSHCGLILTSDRRFNRNTPRAIGQLVTALDAFLRTQPEPAEPTSLVHWLQ
jgi:hypothetical protein